MATKRRSFAKKETMYEDTPDGQTAIGVRFRFTDGIDLSVRNSEFPDSIRSEAESHGFKQKFGDSYNKATTVAEARDIAREYIQRVQGGDWNAERAGGFGIADRFILAAIAEMREKTPDEIQVTWDTLSEERRDNIRKDTRVKATAERIRADEKAAQATVETADSLGEF